MLRHLLGFQGFLSEDECPGVNVSIKVVSVSSFAPVECVEGWSWDAKDAKSYSRSLGREI